MPAVFQLINLYNLSKRVSKTLKKQLLQRKNKNFYFYEGVNILSKIFQNFEGDYYCMEILWIILL